MSAIVALLALLVAKYEDSGPAFGGATAGLPSTLASSSLTTIGSTTPVTIFETTTNCLSRVITSGSATLRFSTGSTSPEAGRLGHVQAASTTVAYDSAVWGCGQWRAISDQVTTAVASTTIQRDEYN